LKFLLDEGLSPRVQDLLRAAGHDVAHVRDMGLQSASDPVVLAAALEQGRVY
jgi:predicted nuclease of predicted toxin-antitoxin system